MDAARCDQAQRREAIATCDSSARHPGFRDGYSVTTPGAVADEEPEIW
jgi:hypothetical protein